MLSPCRQGWSLPLCPYQRLRRISSTAGLPSQWAARRGGGAALLTRMVLQRSARGHTQHSATIPAAGGNGAGAHAAAPSAATSDRVLGVRVEVRDGDTLDGLAAEVGLPREALLAANQGSAELTPGDVLEVLLGKASPVIDVGSPSELGEGDAAAVPQQSWQQLQQQQRFSDSATPTKRQAARDERRAGRRRQLREFEAEQRQQQWNQQQQQQHQQEQQLKTTGVQQQPDWQAQALSRQPAASTAGVGDAAAAMAAEAVAEEPASLPVRLREQATSVLSSPVAIGFLVALAAATLGSRLLQATGRGRDAAAQRAADSPEAAMLAAAASAARDLGSEDQIPAEDDILGRGRPPTAAAGSRVDSSGSGSGSGSGSTGTAAPGPAASRHGGASQPQPAAEAAGSADAAAAAPQQPKASNGSGASGGGVSMEADLHSRSGSSGSISSSSSSSSSSSNSGGEGFGGQRSDRAFPVGTSPVDAAAFMALPYLATVREEGSGRAVLVSLLGGEDAMLAFESRKDASDFANVTGSIDPEAPVAAVFHSPVDLAARVAARGCGLVVVPRGAVQMRIGDGHAKFFRDLFSSCRVLSPAAAAGLLQPAPDEASAAAANASRHAAAAPAAAKEPASAAQAATDEGVAAATDAAADAVADTPAAAAPPQMAAAAAAAETPADSAQTETGSSAAAEQTEQSSAAAAANGAEPLLAVGLSLEGAEPDEEAEEVEWSDDDWESDAEGSAESPAEGLAAPFDGVIDGMPEPAGSRNGSSGSSTSRGSSDGSNGSNEGSRSSDDSGSPAGRGSITAATLPPGAWQRLPFVCVPHVRYAADADAVSFVTADLTLEGQQPVRHVLAFADRHDASAVQAVFMREASAPAAAQLHIVPMIPAEAAAAARQHGFDGVTVFAGGAMRLRPGMGLEDLAQLAYDALRGGGDTGDY